MLVKIVNISFLCHVTIKQTLSAGNNSQAWARHKTLIIPGGQRLLYGYMAEKGDIDYFNQHSQGTIFCHLYLC